MLGIYGPFRVTEGGALSGDFGRPRLAHYRDLDLAWILHRLLDLLRDVAGQAHRGQVVDFLGLYQDAHLTAGLDGEGALHALERRGDGLQRFQTLGVALKSFHACAGPSTA